MKGDWNDDSLDGHREEERAGRFMSPSHGGGLESQDETDCVCPSAPFAWMAWRLKSFWLLINTTRVARTRRAGRQDSYSAFNL